MFLEIFLQNDFRQPFLLARIHFLRMMEYFMESILIIIHLSSLIDLRQKMQICVYLQSHEGGNHLQ